MVGKLAKPEVMGSVTGIVGALVALADFLPPLLLGFYIPTCASNLGARTISSSCIHRAYLFIDDSKIKVYMLWSNSWSYCSHDTSKFVRHG